MAQIHLRCEVKRTLREPPGFQMAAERWLVVLLLLCCSNHGGALSDGRATDLSTTKDDSEAISLAVHEPNGENMEETYYNEEKREKLQHKTWSNQCMRGGSRTPVENERKGTYSENFENEIYEGHGRKKVEEKVTRSYGNSSYMEVEQKRRHYLVDGVYMNVEGMVIEYDKGLNEDTIDGKDLATMNRFYEYVNGVVYMVNFVYNNLDEYLTAELYMVVTLVGALMLRLKRRSTKKRMRRSHLGCYEKKVVLWMPVARLERRRQRLQELCLQKKVKVVLWLSMMGSAQAMQEGMQGGSPVASGSQGERVFLERVTSLTEAATAAANAAAQALSSMQSRSSTGLESATRILKSPDVFTGEDPMVFQTWKFQFSSWLSFGDQRFQEVLEKVEALRDDPADPSSFTTEEKELSTKLYTVLATYLKGRCFNMVKAGMKAKNGFLLWRQLHKEFLPSTRQRTLALAQALSAYPTFPKEKSSLECVLAFEQMVQQFEESSMSSYPDELKSATLIRCCHAKVREYLQLTVTDSTTYGDIREAILSHDRASKVWSQETVLRSLTQGPAEQRTDGPIPMEVDRVFMEKGKGKEKGKFKGGKGKGGDWTSAWGFLRGKGRGRGFKGKGKDKGKQKGKKGKSKGKSKGKNKSKGKLGQNQCSECLQYGHWARDCPNKMRVNQVEQSEQVPQQAQQPSQGQAQFPGGQRGPCSSTAASSSNSTVRRVFNIDLPSLSSESMASGSVRVIFEEVVEEIIEENLVNNIEEKSYNDMEEEVVILDSGSDVSLLPKRHQRNLEGSTLGCRLQNCQGGTLEVAGVKHAELHVQARGGQGAVLQHRFVVGDVQSCIMSLGELYQAGWHIDKDGDELSLLPPDGSMKVPVFYKNKSLAIRAHVRCIQEVLQEEEAEMVRAVIQLNDNFNLEQFNRWQTTTDGVPYLLTKRSRFADPRPVFGGLWSYRSTFYKRIDEGRWYVAEIGNKFMDNEEPFGSIPEIAGDLRDVDILTVLSKGDEPMDYFGRIMDEGGVEAMPVDNEDDGFLGVVQLQPEQDLRHGGDLRPEEVQGDQQEVEGHEIAVPVEAEAEEDKVVVGDMELTRYSMIRDLRRACRYLGVSQAG